MKRNFLTYFISSLFTILLLIVCAIPAYSTDITISSNSISGFYPTGLQASVTGTATVTNSSVTVTSSAAFKQDWVTNNYSGFIVSLGGVSYYVSSVASTSSLTLSSAYAGSSGSISFTVYPFVLLRFYANRSFTVSDGTYIVQSGTPGSGAFFRQYACSVILNTLYIPQVILPSTTDSLDQAARGAKWVANFYLTSGALIKTYDCFGNFALPSNPTSQTWASICTYNTPYTPIPPNFNTYSTDQVNSLLSAVCSTTCQTFTVGSGTASTNQNFDLRVSSNANHPALRYNGTTGVWQLSNDGTTFANIPTSGSQVTSVNSLTGALTITTGTSGTDFAVANAGTTITINNPQADGTHTGKLAAADWTTFNNKPSGSGASAQMALWSGASTLTTSSSITYIANASAGVIQLGTGTGTSAEIVLKGTDSEAVFYNGNTLSWMWYNASSANFFIRDSVNARQHVSFTPGASNTAASTEFASNVIADGVLTAGSGAINLTNATGNILAAAVASADKSGNGSKLGTITGSTTSGKCLEWDASGNIVTAVSNAACGSGGGSNPFADNAALVKNNADNTKLLIISAASITTGTTRTLTAPDVSGTIATGTGTTGKLLKYTTGASGVSGDSIITESSTKIGVNQASPASLLTNTNTLLVDGASNGASATEGLAWSAATAKYVASLSNTNNATSSSGLLIGITNTNANSYVFNGRVGSASSLVGTGTKRWWLGRNLGTDFSVGDDTDLHIQSDGLTSSTYGLKVDNGSFNSFSVRNDGVLIAGSGGTQLTDSTGKLLTAALNTVAVGQGGTGATTLTSNGVLYGNTTSAVQVTSQGAANSVLVANAGAPSFTATPTINTSVQIGVASSVTGQLKLANSGNSNILSIKAGSTGSAITLQLPADTGTNGYCLLTDGGASTAVLTWGACSGGGGSSVWSSLTAPVSALSLSMAANTTTFTWGATTGAGIDLFNLADTASNTGTGHILKVNTASASSAKVVQFSSNGNGVEMTSNGYLTSLGSGGMDASGLVTGTVANARLTAQVFLTNQSNTVTTGTQDFGAATNLKVPVAAGAAPTTSGFISYDSTANGFKGGANSSTVTFATSATSPITLSSAGTIGLNVGVDHAFTVAQTITRALAAATKGDGLSLINSAAATSGNQRFSPSMHWTGAGFGTTGSASQAVEYIAYISPIQGASAPTANLNLDFAVNGGSFTNQFTFGSAGAFTANTGSFVSSSSLTLGQAGVNVGSVAFNNATSGAISIAPPTGALGTPTNTLQAVTDTFVYKTTTDTLTNKTLTSSTNVLGGVTMTLGSDADGDIYYRASNVLTRLAKGTATQLLHSGTTPSWSAISMTADVTGTLPVGNGGTGATTFTSNGVLYGNTTSAVQVTAQGAANSVLTANAGAPSFSATPRLDALGLGQAAPTAGLAVTGKTINTDADGTVAANATTFSVTKNDSNTRAFSGVQIKPTFNTGASNTNTTVDILQVDSTNTAVTGLTVNLLDLMYGGTSAFTVLSTGALTATDAATINFTDANTSTTANLLTLDHESSGTPAADQGVGILFKAKSATVANRTIGNISANWLVATDATRDGYLLFGLINVNGTTSVERMRMTRAALSPGSSAGLTLGTASLPWGDINSSGVLNIGSTPTALTDSAGKVLSARLNTVAVGQGGLGITTTPSNGFIPIGNGTNYTAAALTAGSGIGVTNASGAVTVALSVDTLSAHATHNTTQNTTSGTWTAISFNTDRRNNGNVHFTSTANLTGTLSKTASSAAVVGSSTLFTTELTVGQVITIPGTASEYCVVTVITDNTHLTCSRTLANTASGQTAARINSPLVARVAGWYTVSGVVEIQSNSTGSRYLAFMVNNTTTVTSGTFIGISGTVADAAGTHEIIGSTSIYLNQWDTVELLVKQTSGSTLTVNSQSNYSPEFKLVFSGT